MAAGSGGNGSGGNGSGGPTNGDILSSLSSDVTLIKGDTGVIRTNTGVLSSMNQNISTIMQNVGRWSQQDARSRIYDTSNNGRNGQNGPFNRNNQKGQNNQQNNQNQQNRNRDRQRDRNRNRNRRDIDDDYWDDDWSRRSARRNSGRPEDFIDSFFEEMEQELFGSSFKNVMQQNMKDFAAAMGLQVQDLPGAFGKALANQVKQTTLAKDLTTRVNGMMDRFWDSSMTRMRQGIQGYYDHITARGGMSSDEAETQQKEWEKIINSMTENFRNRREEPPIIIPEDETQGGNGGSGNPPTPPPPTPPGPNPSDPGNPPTPPTPPTPPPNPDDGSGNPPTPPTPPPDPKVPKILEDKLQYLYPIYNTISTINEAVRIIANSVGTNQDDLTNLGNLFKENNDENTRFIDDLLSQGQGGPDLGGGAEGGLNGGSLLDSVLGDAGVQGALGDLTGALGSGALDVGAGLAGVASAALPVAAGFLAVNAALWLVDKAIDAFVSCFDPLKEGFNDLLESAKRAANRFFISEKQKIKDETDRLKADVRTLVETPFDILKEAVEDWTSAWDSNLKTINATQGYTKADLQNLMSSYAERVRAEGLGSTVSAADISENLGKVLESGLSGKAAEEFAYLATILQNAVPNQDFFGYASTYASIAANQIAAGKSQAEAIEAANAQLTQFASNLLYSSRELAGGFSTGLSNASDLLENAVKIANTAGVNDSSYISGVLTAISSTVGAVAPDLAGSITDAIVDAALGGNSDELVALRSLANTGASNTAFLNAFARDPKGVLTTLFTNLSNMQNMNTSNFMEVAESLASTFGMSLGALTRVDFSTVANAVSNMDVTMKSLDQNIKLLKEGQTTTTAEQLKINQINEMILNEGLSYVLDNQAARAIQQHMWDQEIAAELMETEYSVDLTGKALEFLSSIKETVYNILNFLNPFSWIGKIFSVLETAAEASALKGDIKSVLEAGKVGQGNSESLYNLTTYDVDRLTNKPGNLAEMMGRGSTYRALRSIDNFTRAITSFGLQSNISGNIANILHYGGNALMGTSAPSPNIDSQYRFATKGLEAAIANNSFAAKANAKSQEQITATVVNYESSQQRIASKAEDSMQQFLDTMSSYVKDDKSFEEWTKSAQGYGISNLNQALASFNLTMTDLQSKYQEYQAAKSTQYNYDRDQQEEALWDKLKEFMDEDLTQFFEDVKSRLDIQIDHLSNIETILTSFVESWRTDWLETAWSNDWLQTAWRTEWLQNAWRTSWLQNAWQEQWINQAWKTDWIQNAWTLGWILTDWRKNWLQDAWRTDWIQNAWQEAWLRNAWQTDWIDTAWRQEWIENAWNNGFLLMWKTEWLEKAWKQSWLEKAWGEQWLDKAWGKNWLEKAWGEQWIEHAWSRDWIEDAWGQKWLEEAWKQEWLANQWEQAWLNDAWNQDWLKDAWETNWLDKAWKQDWLTNAWATAWLKENWQEAWLDQAWGNDWLVEAWQKKWIEEAFQQQFVHDVMKMFWGNNWWEFFNIFRDRFGGIETADTPNGTSEGATSINTEGLYQIYTKETGRAAEEALKEVEQSDETGDAILALTKQLTQNTVDLRDPQVQTNVLLSQILIVLEAIMQAENVSGGAALATTLAALGMGLESRSTSNAITGNEVVSL